MQVASLRDIHSETRDGAAIIRLNFDFGTNTDLAFIEVNEKIDAAMNYLPREVERPRVIKASATDIPVFCLNLTLKSDSAYSEINEGSFLDLCQFAETVIKRRIEQLPEVAMVDVTGIPDVKFGDRATLVGHDGDAYLSIDELANLSGRFNYEFICDINKRVPREYLRDGKVVEQVDYF